MNAWLRTPAHVTSDRSLWPLTDQGSPGVVGLRLDAFEVRLRAKLALNSQKIKLAEAIRYALSRWQGLTRFIDDGRIELDNNTVERSTRGSKLSRKNALFAGSNGGAEEGANDLTERVMLAVRREWPRVS